MLDKIQNLLKLQDVKYIHELTKELSLIGNDGGEYGFRVSGSSGEMNVARRIEEEMKKIGLQNVHMDEFPVHSWEFLSGKLEVATDDEIVRMDMSSYCGIKGTEKSGIKAEIVDVGMGTAADYEGKDVRGKIVFCTFDISEDFWISAPVYQAEVKGAVGCIISYSGDFYGTKEDAINCFDSQCKYSLPVGNISRKNANILRGLMEKGSVTVCMKLDIKVDFNGKSRNVIGYIPGEDPEKFILMGGHMDGYFHAYQDDMLGVVINIGIAKSIIEAGIKPKHTVVIIAHGSEEYGVTESRYDWCIGSWHSINNLKAEWFGKMTAFLNIDAIRPGTSKLWINSPQSYHDFFKSFIKTLNVPKDCWPEGVGLKGLNGPWSDDYNYAICGIPGIICGRGPAEWSYQNYHTQFDNYTVFESEKGIVTYIAGLYTRMLFALDDLILPPFKFSRLMEELKDSFEEEAQKYYGGGKDGLLKLADSFSQLADDKYLQIININEGKAKASDAPKSRQTLFEVYRILESDFMKLDPFDSVIFAHEAVASNCIMLDKIIDDLKKNDNESALKKLTEIDINIYAVKFDLKVYKWLMDCQDNTRKDLFWGTNKNHKFFYGFDLAEAIRKGENSKALDMAAKFLEFSQLQLHDILNQEKTVLIEAGEKLVSFNS
ncbi:MAG: M28 family peptidase [Eubacteriales bacterium]|nr:M28 family peptidase [Eubacteriales bacterium]